MSRITKIYLIGGLILLISILVSIVYIQTHTAPPSQHETPVPTPVTSHPSPSMPVVTYVDKQPLSESIKDTLVKQLPLITSKYDIEYLKQSDRFIVSIKAAPIETAKEAAVQWFKDNGVANPNQYHIYYNIPRYLPN